MVVGVRGTLQGLRHLGLGIGRVLLRRPHDFHARRRLAAWNSGEVALNSDGTVRLCQVCGFALIKVKFNEGWLAEMCSAWPTVHPHAAGRVVLPDMLAQSLELPIGSR